MLFTLSFVITSRGDPSSLDEILMMQQLRCSSRTRKASRCMRQLSSSATPREVLHQGSCACNSVCESSTCRVS